MYASTLAIPGGLEMTTSKDVLEALAEGAGPRRLLITLGYSAWGEGQLESEIAENAWLTVGADQSVIFETPIHERYDRALALLGVQADDLNVSYEVLEMPQKTGFLGLKTTPAKVRVSVELPDAPAAAPAKPVEPVAEQPVETAAPVQETAPVAEKAPVAEEEPAAPAEEAANA